LRHLAFNPTSEKTILMPSGWTIGHLPVSAGHARLALRSGGNNLCPPKEKSSSKPSWQVLCWRVAKTYSNPRDLKEKDVLSTFRTHLAHPPTIMVHWNFG